MRRLLRFLTLGIAASEAVITGIRRPLGYQQITSLLSSIGFTLPTAIPGNQIGYAVCQAEGGDIRWRDDGTAPTGTVGMIIPSGGELNYCGDFSAIRFIGSTGSSPTALNVSYYGN